MRGPKNTKNFEKPAKTRFTSRLHTREYRTGSTVKALHAMLHVLTSTKEMKSLCKKLRGEKGGCLFIPTRGNTLGGDDCPFGGGVQHGP